MEGGSNLVRLAAVGTNFKSFDFFTGWLPEAYATNAADAKKLAALKAALNSYKSNVSLSQIAKERLKELEKLSDEMSSICSTPQGTVLAVSPSGKFILSKDAGKTWKTGRVEKDLSNIPVCLINDKLLAIGLFGVYQINSDTSFSKSKVNWQKKATSGLSNMQSAHASTEFDIAAVGQDGVFLTSQDGGKTWQDISSDEKIDFISIAEANNNELVAFDSESNFYLKQKSSTTWKKFSPPSTFLKKISRSIKTFVVTKQGKFLGSGTGGLVVSYEPQQQKWQMPVPKYSSNVHSIVQLKNTEVKAFNTQSENFFSKDNGNSWQIENTSGYKQVIIIENKIGAITLDGKIDLTNDKSPWARLPPLLDLESEQRIPDVAFFKQFPNDELAIIGTSGKWLSQQKTKTFWVENTPIFPAPVDLVALSDGRLLALSSKSGLMVSDKERKQWQMVNTAKDIPFYAAITTRKKTTIAVGKQGDIATTSDAGNIWQTIRNTKHSDSLRSIIELTSGTVITAGDNGAYAHSTNDGQSWTFGKMPLAMRISALHQTDTGRVIAGAEAGMFFYSDDQGKTWQAITYQRYPAPWYWFVLTICTVYLLWMFRKITRTKPETTVPQPERAIDLVISDRPVRDASEDRLGFTQVIAGVSKFIRNENTSLPLTFAITGEWGRGKSSMMEMLKNDLQQHHFLCMWFNPWHYQKEEHVLAAMLEKLQKSAVPDWYTPFGILFRLRLLAQRMREQWVFVCFAFGIAFFSIAILTSGKFDAPKTMNYLLCDILPPDAKNHENGAQESKKKASEEQGKECKSQDPESSLGKVIGIGERALVLLRTNYGETFSPSLWQWLLTLLAISPALVGIWRGWKAFSEKSSILLKSVDGILGLRTAEKQTNFRANFAEEFKQITHALGKRRLVIFIDDLDRCKPETVMDIMEAINFLAVSGECFVIIGIDVRKVAHSIGLAQSKLALQLRPNLSPDEAMLEYGTLYLLKMTNFQIPVGRIKTSLALQLMVDSNEVKMLEPEEKESKEPVLDLDALKEKLRKKEAAKEKLRLEVALQEKMRKLRQALGMLRQTALTIVVLGTFAGFLFSAHWLGQQLRTPVFPAKNPAKEEAKPVALAQPAKTDASKPAATPPNTAKAESTPAIAAAASQKEKLGYLLRPAVKAEAPRSLFAAVAAIALFCLFLALKGIGKLVPPQEKDSQSFLKACKTWAPVISELFLAPREIKRWVNRARYLSARLRVVSDAPAFWQRVQQQIPAAHAESAWRPYVGLAQVWFSSPPQASEQRLFSEEQILALASVLSVVAFFDDCVAMPGRVDLANCTSFAEMVGNLPARLTEADSRERQLHYIKVKAAINQCMQAEEVLGLNISSEAITAFVTLCARVRQFAPKFLKIPIFGAI